MSSRRLCSVFVALLVASGLYAPEFVAATDRPVWQLGGDVQHAGADRLPANRVDIPGDHLRVTILLRTPSSLAARGWMERAALAPVLGRRIRSSRRLSRASLKRYVLRQ